ncbi:MAG: Paraquat-inducible protein A [Candidatus Omnitrophica bacterium]|nr:Paraquat-inducible protein A [Candidatus Omnitrophota bacterium]
MLGVMTPQVKRDFSSLLLLTLAAVLFVCGILMPVITVSQMFFFKDTFSVISGIEALWNERHRTLAVIVLLFSIVFPAFKLSLLAVLWARPISDPARKNLIRLLGWMGKWSMLDVFVVAVTVVIAKLSGFADAQARIGIYLFGASVLITMIAAWRIERSQQAAAPRS